MISSAVFSQPDTQEFQFPSSEFFMPVAKTDGSKIILGEPNFEKIRDITAEKNIYNTSRRVASLILEHQGKKISFCSGSLVGPDLLLSNNHCIIPGKQIYVNMEYLNQSQLTNVQTSVVKVLKTSKALDYALFKLKDPIGKHFGWLELSDRTPARGDVMIIQHPQGRDKELSRVQSNILANNGTLIHYFADTEGGSSGSPVFNLNGTKIIALHHAGLCEERSQDKRRCLSKGVNEGIVIGKIKNEIREFLPPCADDGDFPGEFPNKCAYLQEDE